MNTEIFWQDQIGFPVLTLLIFLPLAGAISLWLRRDGTGAKWEAMGISLIELVLSLMLLRSFASGVPAMQFVERLSWIEPLGISYHLGLDGISLFLVILTALITVLTLLYSWDRVADQVRGYLTCLLVLESVMIGVFSALDLVLFFLFWEVMLIPMYFLIRNWGSGPQREGAALKYVVYNLTGSVLMLVGFIILYLNYHHWAVTQPGRAPYSFDYLQMLLAPIAYEKQLWIFGLIFLGFAFKGPIFPFHTWQPSVMLQGPIAVGVILSGVKLGSYGLLRLNVTLTPEASKAAVPLMMALALIGLLYGALIALSRPNLMSMMAYAGISHLGFVTIGLFALNSIGIQGAVFQMVNLGLAGAGLMFVLGFLMDRRGSLELSRFGGLAREAPWLAAASLFIVLASLALPGTSVFVGEFMVLVGVFKVHWISAGIGVVGVILTAGTMLYMYERVMLRGEKDKDWAAARDLNGRESVIAVTMISLIFWIGFYPAPLLTRMEPSVRAVMERYQPVEFVLPSGFRFDPENPHGFLRDLLIDPPPGFFETEDRP